LSQEPKRFTISVTVEIDDGVYWPKWVMDSSPWQDNLGYLLAYCEEMLEHIHGLSPVMISADDPKWKGEVNEETS